MLAPRRIDCSAWFTRRILLSWFLSQTYFLLRISVCFKKIWVDAAHNGIFECAIEGLVYEVELNVYEFQILG